MDNKRLHIESGYSFEEGATFVALENGGMSIAVAEEQAVDSYNQSFTCHATLNQEQAVKLRDWLINNLVRE
jgi:hypothetical protein